MKKSLVNRWLKSKRKLQKAQAKEADLRSQIDLELVKKNKLTDSIIVGNDNIKFTRASNYSIPKASIVDIKLHIDDDAVFNKLFTTSYKLKKTTYSNLSDGEVKNSIKSHLTIKDAPLSVSFKEV